MIPPVQFFLELLIGMYFVFFSFGKRFCCVSWDDHIIFVFWSIYEIYYTYLIAIVKQPLHFQDKANLIILLDLCDGGLYCICYYFIWSFYIYSHLGYCSRDLLSLGVLCLAVLSIREILKFVIKPQWELLRLNN